MKESIVKINQLCVSFKKKEKVEQEIIHGIDLVIPKGEIVGIVGESGSGKSLTMKALMNLLPENGQFSYQEFEFNGKPWRDFSKKHLPVSMIFQDPMTSLNPLRTISCQLF